MNDDLSIMKVYAFGTNINNQVCSNTDENKIVFPHELTIQNNQIKCCCETEISPFDKSGEFPDFRIIFSEINCLFNRKLYTRNSSLEKKYNGIIKDWNSSLTHTFRITEDGELKIDDMVSNLSEVDVKCKSKNEKYSNIYLTDSQIILKDVKDLCYELVNLSKCNPCINPLNITSVKLVSCGAAHILLLSHDGSVYALGDGSRGQLGNGSTENVTEPTCIPALMGVEVKTVSAGGWHSAAITSTDDLYIWGWNDKGQLGFPSKKKNKKNINQDEVINILCTPHWLDIPDEEYIKDVSCGSQHTIAVAGSGKIYGWGFNKYGQLGIILPNEITFIDNPTEINFFRGSKLKIVKIYAKFWTTIVIASKNQEHT